MNEKDEIIEENTNLEENEPSQENNSAGDIEPQAEENLSEEKETEKETTYSTDEEQEETESVENENKDDLKKDDEKNEEEKQDIRELIKSFDPIEYFDYVNLHIHSKFSDGKAEFEDIIQQAKELGYKKIAICDHNTVEGHKLYQDEVLIPAVEFDCWCGYVFLHLLAYGIDVNNPVLDEFMAKSKSETEADIVRIFAKRDIKRLINAIHEAGGIAVLAHPACCWALSLDKFVGKLVSYGLDGIEVHYPYRRHRAIIRFASLRQIKDIAEKYNLIITGGTDCHTRNIMSY